MGQPEKCEREPAVHTQVRTYSGIIGSTKIKGCRPAGCGTTGIFRGDIGACKNKLPEAKKLQGEPRLKLNLIKARGIQSRRSLIVIGDLVTKTKVKKRVLFNGGAIH